MSDLPKNLAYVADAIARPYKQFVNVSFDIDTTVSTNLQFTLNSNFACSKVRFSLGSVLNGGTNNPAITVFCSAVGDIIGNVKSHFAYVDGTPTSWFIDPLEPSHGITFFYTNKVFFNGTYSLLLKNINGTAITNQIVGKLILVVEMWA